MAVQQLDVRPQEGFNVIFSDIVNCEITPPPYNDRYLSKFFFLKKRKWIKQIGQKQWYDFLDYNERYDFYLTRNVNTNNYEVLDNNFNTVVTITGWWTADIFVEVLWWTIQYDTGTATGWSSTTLVDTSKNWTNNELAWYYVYIYDWTGAWQLRYIVSNTSDTITVSWFDTAPASWSKYRVYEKLDYNLTVPYKNWLYVYDWSNWNDEPIFSGYDIENMVVWNSRLWYTSWNKLYHSEEWDYYNYPVSNQLILWSHEVNNLYPFWSYLIVWTKRNISLVYKGFSSNDWTEFFVVKEWTSTVGIKNKFGIASYQWWLYIIWSDYRMYALRIQLQWTEASVLLNDNWSIPAYFINRYKVSDVKLYSDTNNIYLYTYDFSTDRTYEVYYNSQYKGWLNNEYNVKINKKFFQGNTEYVLCKDLAGMRWDYKDFWGNYKQRIEIVVWEQDIWNWKNLKYINILLWKTDYVQDWYVEVISQIANKKIKQEFDLGNMWYITDIWDLIENTFWWPIIWTSLYWWDVSDLYNVISDVDIIQIGLDTTGQIFNIIFESWDWENGLLLWWVFLYYNTLNPKQKYIKNII